MPVYVYGCKECGERREIRHGYDEDPAVVCECGGVMHRVPQVVRYYLQPVGVLLDQMDERYRAYRKRKALRH